MKKSKNVKAGSQEEKPWKGICSPGCWTAKHERCTCRCEGRNHGSGVHKHIPDYVDTVENQEKARKLRQLMMDGESHEKRR